MRQNHRSRGEWAALLLGAFALLDELLDFLSAFFSDLLVELRPMPLRRHLAALSAGVAHGHSTFVLFFVRLLFGHSGLQAICQSIGRWDALAKQRDLYPAAWLEKPQPQGRGPNTALCE